MVCGVVRIKSSVLLVCIILILSKTTLGGEDRTYYNQAVDLVGVADSVLIDNKLCLSDNDCGVKKMAFWGVNRHGVRISIYNIKNRVVAARLVEALMDRYARDPVYDLEVIIFDKRWEDVGKISFFQDPILRLTVKHGGEK